ncbi:N-acetylmuramoyl-L-alanine amidase [Fundicoccus ignavus]|uniref:N-acetylmuramoyl-L-alanine amidase n=1 Tax=Fundicoccus ignavus TaxID=2664442 RepID=A0A844CC40_9LACT|nr:N-acetylmuramoyl-L-alanine amidase [Fundicoccus ignavus]MRJ47071.1 LysM peptidoglycan-binding domain-containing protein [Fundicoccus ignavus]
MATLRPIKKDLTQVNRGAKGANRPQWIVIHFVGASGQAQANADYFRHTFRSASAHYFIDPQRIIQVVEDDTPAWHIGDGFNSGLGQYNGYHRYGATNNNSIGIEGCQDTSTGKNVWYWDFHPKTYEQMLLLTLHLQEKYNIPDSRVIRHYDASGKICPGNWQWNNWAKWHQFKLDLSHLRKNVSDNSLTSDSKIDDGSQNLEATYTIQVGDTLSKIAKNYKVSVDDLVLWNQIENKNLIYPETKLFVQAPDKVRSECSGIKQAGKVIPRKGQFKFTDTVNVRNQPGAYGKVPEQYKPGETVKYDEALESGGFIWLKYQSYQGTTQYVSAGTPTVPYGKFI